MFTTIVIQPLYNAFIFLVNYFPGHEVWIALVILTLLLKIILIPLFKKQVRDQVIMTFLAPKLKEIQEKYKNDREKLGKETLGLYSKYKINPFVSILILIIQLPFLIGLYQIFYYDLNTYQNLLYGGLALPENINHFFFGINLTEKSLLLAILAGVTQYILGTLMFKLPEKSANSSDTSLLNNSEFMNAMNIQMKYFLPLIIGGVSYFTPSVIALYLLVTNIFSIIQEIIIKKPLEAKLKKEFADK